MQQLKKIYGITHMLNNSVRYVLRKATDIYSKLKHSAGFGRQNKPTPKELRASGSNITGRELIANIKGSPDFQIISINGCENLGDIFANDLPELTQLDELDISGSTITGTALFQIIKKAHKLRHINAFSCKNLTTVDKIKLIKIVNNRRIRLDTNPRGPDFRVNILNEDLVAHFETLLQQDRNRIATTMPIDNALSHKLPGDLIFMVDACLSNELVFEMKILKELFPEQEPTIASFENSAKFKELVTKCTSNSHNIIKSYRKPKSPVLNSYEIVRKKPIVFAQENNSSQIIVSRSPSFN